MVESWLSAPLLWPSSSRMTVFQRCQVLSRLGWSAKFGGQIARSLSRHAGLLCNISAQCSNSVCKPVYETPATPCKDTATLLLLAAQGLLPGTPQFMHRNP